MELVQTGATDPLEQMEYMDLVCIEGEGIRREVAVAIMHVSNVIWKNTG